jgi:hypothetical protein
MKSKIWPQRPRKLPLDLNNLRRGSLPTLILKMSCVFFAFKSRYKAAKIGIGLTSEDIFGVPIMAGFLNIHPPHKIVLIRFMCVPLRAFLTFCIVCALQGVPWALPRPP